MKRHNQTEMTPYERTVQHATHTASMLKLIAHPHRLMILCLLAESEHNVTELVKAVGINQTAVSNHLAKMRADGIVDYTRYHRVLQYRLISPEVRAVLDTINGQCLHREDADGTSEQAS